MITVGKGKCKCTDEITDHELKKQFHKCLSVFDELFSKLQQHSLPFCEESLQDDSIINFHTGLWNLKVTMDIFNHVCITLRSERTETCKLIKFQHFVLVLIKLRLDSPIVDLAYRFGVSPATISRIVLKMAYTNGHQA